MPLLIVGSVAFDTVKTPGGIAEDVLGGSATYCAYAAGFFTPVWLVSPVGEDLPEEHFAAMRRRNIDTAGLRVVAGGKTFRWVGRYNEDLSERITERVDLNVFDGYDTTLPEPYREAEYVFLANGDPAAQTAVIEQLTRRKQVFLDTMNHWIEGARSALYDAMKRVDGMVLNDGEARLLTGRGNLLTAAREIARLGPRTVVIKKGEHGAILYEDGRTFVLPARLTETVHDPTGAGDCFGGALMGYVAEQDSAALPVLKRGVLYGTILASFCIEDFSLRRLETLTRGEIEERREEFLAMIAWD
jgi:sugar/nucleoside kinase (ribokinase family)